MTPERWQQVERVYHAALRSPAPERAGLLAKLCAGDDALRQEVETLLAQAEATEFPDVPALAVAASALGAPAASLVGRRIGVYSIQSLIGVGGMGEVYRARDTRLGRDVAIKVPRALFAADPERLRRLEREARLLAALNHPHIGAIYGFEQTDAVNGLVLELVEGPTLADRLAQAGSQGPGLPVDQALRVARQIAEALEAAHEKGIVHRDLKPANIKLTPDGTVKVLDFGLAKVAAVKTPDLAQSPTLSRGGTREGTIVGTAAYMSPEQARGQPVDKRTDIWAFGCVLYEMLTGRAAFARDTISDTTAAILEHEPDWQALPSGTPSKIGTLLERCLRKDARRRLRDIGDARIEIEEAGSEPAASNVQPVATRPSRRSEFVWAVLALLFLLTAAGVILRSMLSGAPARNAPAVRFDVFPPEGATPSGLFQLSPDGLKLAFVAASESKQRIWVRPLGASNAESLTSTEGTGPSFFWSADSQYIGFFAGGKLQKVAATGGPSEVVCSLPAGRAYFGSWNAEGVILLKVVQDPGTPLLRVSAAGGQLAPATELDAARRETFHGFPGFLPDGRHFLFLTGSSEHGLAAYVGTLDSKERHALPGIASAPQYSPSGYLFFVRGGALMAQPFDVNRLELSGEAFPVAQVSARPTPLSAALLPGDVLAGLFFSVSTNGAVAYNPGPPAANSGITQLAWFARTGRQLALAAPSGEYRNPALSPDGRYVAFERGTPADIWVLDIEKGVTSRTTRHAAADVLPIWSPDGRAIVFASDRDGSRNLYEVAYGVVGEERQLLKMDAVPTDWSREGRYIALESNRDLTGTPVPSAAAVVGPPPFAGIWWDGTLTNQHIWALPVSGDSKERKPLRVTESRFSERAGRISPDGHWIAYLSTDQLQAQLHIQSFPQAGTKRQVSTKGASTPRWSRDGKEVFYLAPDATLMAVSIKSTGSSLEAGVPKALFKAPLLLGVGLTRDYDVAADGRFLINVTNPASAESASTPISVILNWSAGLRRTR